MRQPRLVAFFAFAAAVAACNGLDQPPSVPSAPSAPTAPAAPSVPDAPAAPSVPAAPAAPAVPAQPTVPAVAVAPAGGQPAAPKTLKSAMKGIEDDWKSIEKGLESATPDLAAMAKAAERVAAVMKLGYDPFEDKEVPNFAQLARESEAAFLELAKKAAAGDTAGVKAMQKTLQPQHCARCHDAYEEVHG